MKKTFATRVKAFNRSLQLDAALPEGIGILNPFRESTLALSCADAFYDKYYGDNEPRHLILGINPGRFGGGLTGVPFTDFKRLRDVCGIDVQGHSSHEPSSEFIYRMIAALGSVSDFYRRFYINSVCPLGFVTAKGKDKWVNYNYYDSPELWSAVKPFIVQSIRQQIAFGCVTEEVFSLGKKNAQYLERINEEHGFFGKVTELPHPRYVVQYKHRFIDDYIEEYRRLLPAHG